MRRAAIVLLAGLLAGCASPAASAPAAPLPAPDSLAPWLGSARDGVQSALDAGVVALRRHDSEAAFALLAPDFELVTADGTHTPREAYITARRATFARLVDLDASTRTTVGRVIEWTPARPWEAQEPQIVLATHQHASGTARGADGRVGPFSTDFACRETWRHTTGGWLRVRVEQGVE